MGTAVCCCRTLIVEELLLVEEEIELCQILSIDVVFVFESLADDIRDTVYLVDAVREFAILATQILECSFEEQTDVNRLQAALVAILSKSIAVNGAM